MSLGDLHLPDVGYVAVPITLRAGAAHGETRSIDVEIAAANGAGSFPRFSGSAGIEATGPTGSALWLGGEYDVPLQFLGRLFDKTLASGVARTTLENLVDDLAVAVVAGVEKREAEYARYHMY